MIRITLFFTLFAVASLSVGVQAATVTVSISGTVVAHSLDGAAPITDTAAPIGSGVEITMEFDYAQLQSRTDTSYTNISGTTVSQARWLSDYDYLSVSIGGMTYSAKNLVADGDEDLNSNYFSRITKPSGETSDNIGFRRGKILDVNSFFGIATEMYFASDSATDPIYRIGDDLNLNFPAGYDALGYFSLGTVGYSYLNGVLATSGAQDLSTIYYDVNSVTITGVPVPGAFGLFLSGISCLMVFRTKARSGKSLSQFV